MSKQSSFLQAVTFTILVKTLHSIVKLSKCTEIQIPNHGFKDGNGDGDADQVK